MMEEKQRDAENTELDAQSLVERILTEMEKVGDLPIFSASVNRVHIVSSDPSSDAMQLAVEILKDANLSSRVLKLANSPYFNRGIVKIGTLSRAIVLLGFDTIKNSVLTMKMVDSFQHDHPGVDMGSLLVNSYMSAGFVRDLAAQCGLKDIEQSYIYGLFHNLGEIVTAYILPEEFLQIKDLEKEKNMNSAMAQKEVLGVPFRKIGQEISGKWEFPSSVAKTMNPYGFNGKGRIINKVDLNQAIASLTSNMMELLYSDAPSTKHSFSEITKELAKVTGISNDAVANCLDKSFKRSCELAEQFGLNKQLLKPKVTGTGDDVRDKIARELSFYAVSDTNIENCAPRIDENDYDDDDGYADAPQELEEGGSVKSKAVKPVSGDSNIMLGILHELTALMTQKAHINMVFNKVLEGMHRGVGFDRALLILLTPDHKYYLGRMAFGHESQALKEFFARLPVDVNKDLFSKMIMEGTELLVQDIHQGGWHKMLPKNFVENLGATSFMLASIRVRGRPVGLFYADKSQKKSPINSDDHRGFMQLVAQAQLALQLR